MVKGVGRFEAHVLIALAMKILAENSGRLRHLPTPQMGAVIDGMRNRDLIGDDGWLSDQGRAVKQRVESITDDPPSKPYETLETGELIDALEPLAELLLAALDFG